MDCREAWGLRCLYAGDMSKTIQVRSVSDQVHGILKARAAREGQGLSGFLKGELERLAERTRMGEWLALTQKMKPMPSRRSGAQVVRALRGGR